MSRDSSSVRLAVVVALGALAITTAACSRTLDTDGLEERLIGQVERETASAITSVSCPADVRVETGGTFECTAEEASGASFTLEVTQTDDRGNVEWEIIDAAA
jgi:hypothetical protein